MNENKPKLLDWFLIFSFICLILLVILLYNVVAGGTANALAGVSVWDYLLEKAIVENKEIQWTQEMENKRLEALKPKEVVKPAPKEEKQPEQPKEVKIDTSYDLDKLAKAVAIAETGNCTKWYGKEYNNCFGIKNGNTAPCPKIGRSKMCIYEKPEDSYEAFKIIWGKWYKWPPNLRTARRWTWNDNATRWLSHVNLHYYKD